jgi:hypothetical protein
MDTAMRSLFLAAALAFAAGALAGCSQTAPQPSAKQTVQPQDSGANRNAGKGRFPRPPK